MPGCRGSWVLEVNRSREDWEGSNLQRSKANARRSEGPRGQSLDGDFLGAPGGGAGSGLRWVRGLRTPLGPQAVVGGVVRSSPHLPTLAWSVACSQRFGGPPDVTLGAQGFGCLCSKQRERRPRELSAWDATHRPGRKEHPRELGEMQLPGLLQFRGRRRL